MVKARLVHWLVVAASLGASGCTGAVPTFSSINAANEPSALNLNLSPEEVAQSGPTTAFNPFADVTAAPAGGREVIANPTLTDSC